MSKTQSIPDSQFRTALGIEFDIANPNPSDVQLYDIAHSLSLQCRFAGHTKSFYSVAQHSVLAAQVAGLIGLSPCDQRWALMHDASEAYCQDIVRPLKRQLDQYRAIEDRLMSVIADVFGLDMPMPPIVKIIDDTLMRTEQRELMGVVLGESELAYEIKIESWSPETARERFLQEATQLGMWS